MAVGELASLFAVIGGAGSFLIWLYKHLVQKPDQKIRKESTDRIIASEKANRVHLENTLQPDRKSTRLNSSHVAISYAVFCLKKKIKVTSYNLRSHEHTKLL